MNDKNLKTIYLGGGCFWCVEAVFQNIKGVINVESGYAGGDKLNPTYGEVSNGNTGYVEVIKLTYDENIISTENILTVFFASHDPTTFDRQGNDVGSQYRSVIFYESEEEKNISEKIENLGMNDEFLKKELSESDYNFFINYGNERPFSGALLNEHRDGSFHCKVCDAKLFESDAKFDSGTGWPSFDKAAEGAIDYNNDMSLGMSRNEVSCHNCGSHLGHVFNDGPTDTGMRYCINSVCLGFDPEEKK